MDRNYFVVFRSQNIFVYIFRSFICTTIRVLDEVKQRFLSSFSLGTLDHVGNPDKVAQHPAKADLL